VDLSAAASAEEAVHSEAGVPAEAGKIKDIFLMNFIDV